MAERLKKLELIVDAACSSEALKDSSSHTRQLRPLHVLDFKRREITRVRPAQHPPRHWRILQLTGMSTSLLHLLFIEQLLAVSR